MLKEIFSNDSTKIGSGVGYAIGATSSKFLRITETIENTFQVDHFARHRFKIRSSLYFFKIIFECAKNKKTINFKTDTFVTKIVLKFVL